MNFQKLTETFILPGICIIGSLTNLMSIYIFKKIRAKTTVQKYNLAYSIFSFIYLFLNFFSCLTYCDFLNEKFCRSMITKIYNKYIEKFFTSGLALTIVFIQISVAFNHYLLISNKTYILIKYNIK